MSKPSGADIASLWDRRFQLPLRVARFAPDKKVTRMTGSVPIALADRLQSSLFCGHPSLWLFLVRSLANGQPVAQADIAKELAIPLAEVPEALVAFSDIEYDALGDIVSCGLSLLPSPHCLKINGHDLFTWCALDTLMYPVALNQNAQVRSRCPVTNDVISLDVGPRGISRLTPADVSVSIVIPDAQSGCCNVRGSFCSQVHFLSSPKAAATWASRHPDAIIVSVEDAWQLGEAIARRRLSDALIIDAAKPVQSLPGHFS